MFYIIFFFSAQNLVCIFHVWKSQFELAKFQMLNIWLVATIVNRAIVLF